MYMKMKRVLAALPGRSSVPRYFHCSRASARRQQARAGKPMTGRYQLDPGRVGFFVGLYRCNEFMGGKLTEQSPAADFVDYQHGDEDEDGSATRIDRCSRQKRGLRDKSANGGIPTIHHKRHVTFHSQIFEDQNQEIVDTEDLVLVSVNCSPLHLAKRTPVDWTANLSTRQSAWSTIFGSH
jgi:hypothetical protein